MGKLPYTNKLRMKSFREQGLGAKSIISSYPDKGWKLSTVKKVCSRVHHTGSASLRKPGSGSLPRHFHFIDEYSKLDRVKTMSTRGKN